MIHRQSRSANHRKTSITRNVVVGTNDSNNKKIYLGRFGGKTPHYDEWSSQIDLAEKLLINEHKLDYNS